MANRIPAKRTQSQRDDAHAIATDGWRSIGTFAEIEAMSPAFSFAPTVPVRGLSRSDMGCTAAGHDRAFSSSDPAAQLNASAGVN